LDINEKELETSTRAIKEQINMPKCGPKMFLMTSEYSRVLTE
jgi:hypothetical protein